MGAAICGLAKATIGELVMQVSAIEGHRVWAPIYESGLNPVRALERRTVQNLLKPSLPGTVIDVACGTGQQLLDFQSVGSEVFGCDACQEMLNEATKAPSLRGRVSLADAECLPFACSIADLVLCSLSLGYFQNINRVFAEFARTAKPYGLIAVSDLHPDALASGWTRSFRLGTQVYEIEHYRRTLEEVKRAASGAGLSRKLCQDIYFGPAESQIFQSAGKPESWETVQQTPALFIGLWEKPAC